MDSIKLFLTSAMAWLVGFSILIFILWIKSMLDGSQKKFGIFGGILQQGTSWGFSFLLAIFAVWGMSLTISKISSMLSDHAGDSVPNAMVDACLNNPTTCPQAMAQVAAKGQLPVPGSSVTSNSAGNSNSVPAYTTPPVDPYVAFSTNSTVASCVQDVLVREYQIGTAVKGSLSWFPQRSGWNIGPDQTGAKLTFTDDRDEIWSVNSTEIASMQFKVNGQMARSLGGDPGKAYVTVYGTGSLPERCSALVSASAPAVVQQSLPTNDLNTQPLLDPNAALATQPPLATGGSCYEVQTKVANVRPASTTKGDPTGSLALGAIVSGSITQGECLSSGCDWLQVSDGQYAGSFIHMSLLAAVSGCQ